ncbi:membrane protein insertase YidC [Marinoscillum sp. MHG1-6]|uniref:membrane protein insertase YidC n=1 Tax=Marinoscillum sp. MHG1-6 TaxID=2959627 RepID=UPI0021574B7B|nr:membrane protein insertase YidC [Marinoscillum sp. MHG1-6]
MDRNQIIGLVVMLVFITVYFQFFAPEPPAQQATPESSTTEQVVTDSTSASVSTAPALTDSAKAKLDELKYGIFSGNTVGEEKLITIENEDMVVTFNTKGASVEEVILKKHLDFRGEPLVLIDKDHAQQHIQLNHLSRNIDLAELYFQVGKYKNILSGDESTNIVFTLNVQGDQKITYEYSIAGKGYEVGMKILQSGMEPLLENGINFAWEQNMNRVEMDFKDARNRSTVKYRYTDGDVDELDARSTEKEAETLELPSNWISFRQKFFTSAIISNTAPFEKGDVSSVIDFSDSSSVKNVSMNLSLSYEAFIGNNTDLKFYYGPNNYALLKKVAPDFGENVELGWSILSWINKFAIIPIFHFLENYISSYGIIIIIMVFILKLVLSPLTYTSHMGMAKMRVLKPELDEIKAKHGDDMQKAQQEQMALYQKVGINPLSGCIPMLLQMPILFAMFYFFPNSIELRQQSFLWAHDLSTYDSVLNLPFTIPFYGDHVSLFTLLMTASTILYTWSNSQMTASVQGPMKTLQYVMPIMFLFFLNSYSAGLTFYYFISNIVSFGQIAIFRKLIDEEKIKRILEENRKKNANKKKSSFQQRLEDAMKAQDQKKKSRSNKK